MSSNKTNLITRVLTINLAVCSVANVAFAMDTCTVTFDQGQRLDLPIARTVIAQAKGLARVLNPSPGMIFVWEKPTVKAFWMIDTPAALTGVWIGEDGKIQSIQAMQPNTPDAHSSLRPAIAVIEVPSEDFKSQGISRASSVASSTCFALKPSSLSVR